MQIPFSGDTGEMNVLHVDKIFWGYTDYPVNPELFPRVDGTPPALNIPL